MVCAAKVIFLKCIVNGEALNNGAGLCLDLIRLIFEHVRDQVRYVIFESRPEKVSCLQLQG